MTRLLIVPAQYDGKTPACVMVFQDGEGYQINHAWGDGGHSNKHGGAIFPDILRWLWKGYEAKK